MRGVKMITALVHLSDIHLKTSGNVIAQRVGQLAAAICSADTRCRDYVVILTGDIAFSGDAEEYLAGERFLNELRGAVAKQLGGSSIATLAIPGNHDCVLPKSDIALRAALIGAIGPTLQHAQPDEAILKSLLNAQDAFFAFAARLGVLGDHLYQKLCTTTLVQLGQHTVQFALYNTALLSRLHEEQGELLVPLEVIKSHITVDSSAVLTVAVFHHPYNWLQAENAIAFRNYVETTCEIALTGHQHVQSGYTKDLLTGQQLLYLEGDVLQETGKPNASGFHLVLLDLPARLRKVVTYRWQGSAYEPANTSDWAPFMRTALAMDIPAPLATFLTSLSDSGVGLTHKLLGPVTLESVFVYPDASVRSLSGTGTERDVRGDQLLHYLEQSANVMVQGSSYSGKTSLAKSVTRQWLIDRSFYPLLISGTDVKQSDNSFFERLTDAAITKIYGEDGEARYDRIPQGRRALLIDDWDDSKLNHEDRDKFIRRCLDHFGKVMLFVRSVSYIHYLLSRVKGTDIILDFDLVSLNPLSHARRGVLIDKWLTLKLAKDTTDYHRRVAETERLVQSVIGKNTLPSVPLIILAILEASERNSDVLPENGSFGYLYEVLITSALNLTVSGEKPQLDKKYTFLSIFAFRLFERSLEVMGDVELDKLLDEYAAEFRVTVDKKALLDDLQYARVLIHEDGNWWFGYDHYFYYFLARHFKNNLSGPNGTELRKLLSGIVRGLNTGANSTFLMFVIYLTHDPQLMDELIALGDSILADVAPAELTSEVEFYNSKDFAGVQSTVPEVVDLNASRQRRRESADRAAANENARETDEEFGLSISQDGYTDQLPLGTKLDYALRCIEVLGQVLRNFTGSLPGDRKMQILRTTYLLGLRALRVMLESLQEATVHAKEEIAKRDLKRSEDRKFVKSIEHLLTILGQMVGSSVVGMISLNVGSPDIDESAYADTLKLLGANGATELIDVAIKLDHSKEYPYGQLKTMLNEYRRNRFVNRVLRDLIISNMHIFDIGREMRQRVHGLLKTDPSDASLSKTGKRLK
jgi:hypothetical protein